MNGPPSGKRWHTREDSGIRLDREGRWWHDDELVEHPKIIEAFNTGLIPAEDGRFKLQFGPDWCLVEVEDAAYRVVAVDARPDGIGLRLSDRTAELLAPGSLALDPEGVLSCQVKQGRARARFTRDAQFALGDFIDEENGQLVIRTGGRSWPISQS